MRKFSVTVRLSIKDWRDLVNFVGGDLGCMDEDCEVKQQMRRIVNHIEHSCNLKECSTSRNALEKDGGV